MIGPVATAARHLIALGLSGGGLVAALAEIEAACVALLGGGPMAQLPESYSVAHKRSAHAEAQARYMQRKRDRLGVTPDIINDRNDVSVITADRKASAAVIADISADHRAHTQIDSLPSFLQESQRLVCISPDTSARDEPSALISPVTIEALYEAYPMEGGMSRDKAAFAWKGLTENERILAIAACPHLKAWMAKQPANYTRLHVGTYLLEKRFNGYANEIAEVTARPPKVFVRENTAAFEAWKKLQRIPPGHGGWWFPTEWPPDPERQQMNIPLLRQVKA